MYIEVDKRVENVDITLLTQKGSPNMMGTTFRDSSILLFIHRYSFQALQAVRQGRGALIRHLPYKTLKNKQHRCKNMRLVT